MPDHIESILRYASFEKRQNNIEQAEQVLTKAIASIKEVCNPLRLFQLIASGIPQGFPVYLFGSIAFR